MALKLDKKCRWVSVRNFLDSHYNIKVNFSDSHTNYYSAYRYYVKEDSEALHSPDHPILRDIPRTTEATATRKTAAASKSKKKIRRRKKRLSVYEVTQVIRKNGIKSRLELMALASSQEREGKTDLPEFIANRGSKVVDDALKLAHEFATAEKTQSRLRKSRIQLLEEQLNDPCAEGCNKSWQECALQLLDRNGIEASTYFNAMYQALKLGRGKYRNIYIYGPANSGKTFMLAPLKSIYIAFVNPATGSFAWVGAEQAEVILLNDFRWSASIIAWSDFLQMLEGDTMHLAAPKSFMQQDLVFEKDTIFCYRRFTANVYERRQY
ncbi:hypothetical protein QZH41_005244 [Actinostola sp. cb2023]|nr:hypothetical protein QZH41_005244 [Actinostola sp. cb2023]